MNTDITSENVADDVSARPPKVTPQEEIIETAEESAPEVVENVFDTWNLSKEVLKSLTEMKFKTPTSIQTQAIPLLLKREKDFVGLAATGTGKTGAFGIPLVESIDASSKHVQALIMCPTRELATQVEAQIQKIGKWKGLNTLTVFGGSSYDRQLTALKRGVHIVVGTPGRLIDLVERKALKLENVQTLVLDEADEMISMGFQDDLEKILKAIGDDKAKRKWLFSATMSPEIRRVASRYLPDYDKVEIHKQDSERPNIEQIYYTIYPDRKLQMLSSILYMNQEFYGLIFCQTKREVIEITEWLKRKSFPVDCIHGDRPQREREFILNDFRKGRVKILVATDVAARGLDINDLTHVVNFSLPRDVESYVHRIGRTGRAGKKGLALSIVAPHEVRTMKRIQQVTKATLTKGRAPTNDELNVYRVKDVIQEMNQAEKNEAFFRAGKFLERKMEEMKALFTFEFTAEEFLKRYLIAEHSDIFENRETSMDFVGDNVVPREMQDFGSRDRGPVGRDSSGPRDSYRGDRGGGFSRGNDRGGDRGGYRGNNDRNDRPARSFDRGGDREDRPVRTFNRDEAPRTFNRDASATDSRPAPAGDRPYRSNDRGADRYASARPGGNDRGFTSRGPREESAPAAASTGRTWNSDDESSGPRPAPRAEAPRYTESAGFKKAGFGFGDDSTPRTESTSREGRPSRSSVGIGGGDSRPRRPSSDRPFQKRDR
ncbi:MAG: DEAD/DEAH box helicase [Bdellovibrio sp.]|nr:DEAD/DEAH box helicase [Bdellovibrio sp.]